MAGAAPNAGAEEVELPPKRDEPVLAPVGAVGGLAPPCISGGNGLGTLSEEGRAEMEKKVKNYVRCKIEIRRVEKQQYKRRKA